MGREGSTKCIGKVIQLYPSYDPSLSNFDELQKKYLNLQNFEKSYNKNGKLVTMIFDEKQKIVTKDDLRNLENEMKQLKLKQKEKKEHKKDLNEQKQQNENDD